MFQCHVIACALLIFVVQYSTIEYNRVQYSTIQLKYRPIIYCVMVCCLHQEPTTITLLFAESIADSADLLTMEIVFRDKNSVDVCVEVKWRNPYNCQFLAPGRVKLKQF